MNRLHGNTKYSVGELRNNVPLASSWADLYRKIGYMDQPNLSVRKKIKKFLIEDGIDISHLEQSLTVPVKRRTKEELEAAVTKACSYTDLLRVLGLRIAGSNMRCVKNALKRFDICTDKFTLDFKASPKQQTVYRREDIVSRWDQLLDGTLRVEVKSVTLTALMKRDGRKYECSEVDCRISEWFGKAIRLEVDHIDGDRLNQSRENLRYLCPNCHSMTETFGSRNRYSQ